MEKDNKPEGVSAKALYSNEYINTDGNWVHRTAIIGDNVRMGRGNVIMPYAVIGEAGFIRNMQGVGEVMIGNNNRIGCYVNIMSGEKGKTVIGEDCMIMSHVNIGHNTHIANRVEVGAGVIIPGWMNIEDNVKIKVGAILRNRTTIRDGAVIGMGAVVTKNVATGATVFGVPAREEGSAQ